MKYKFVQGDCPVTVIHRPNSAIPLELHVGTGVKSVGFTVDELHDLYFVLGGMLNETERSGERLTYTVSEVG